MGQSLPYFTQFVVPKNRADGEVEKSADLLASGQR